MLQSVDEDGCSDIVSWQPHGGCFLVHKPKEFKKILPKYFGLTKVSSFQRQLNLYGFKCLVRNGPDLGGYYHELILPGKAFLIRHLERVPIQGTGVRSRADPKTEPDFWSMTPIQGQCWSPCTLSQQWDAEEASVDGDG